MGILLLRNGQHLDSSTMRFNVVVTGKQSEVNAKVDSGTVDVSKPFDLLDYIYSTSKDSIE